MIGKIEEFDRYVSIVGFKNVKIKRVDEFVNRVRNEARSVHVQLFDADCVAGWRHIFFATFNALKSFDQKLNISNSLPVEILLYATGHRQIQRAIEMLGIRPDTTRIAVVMVSDKDSALEDAKNRITAVVGGEVDDSVVEIVSEKKLQKIVSLFGVSDLELFSKTGGKGFRWDALTELVIERGTLLATER